MLWSSAGAVGPEREELKVEEVESEWATDLSGEGGPGSEWSMADRADSRCAWLLISGGSSRSTRSDTGKGGPRRERPKVGEARPTCAELLKG